MTARALVLAIESYPSSRGGLARTLAGTHDSAREFCRWLIESKGVEEADLLVCSDATDLPGTARGATADDLRRAVADLVAAGSDATEVLFVFFSGHGLSYTDSVSGRERPADVLVASDFEALADSGNECLRLDEIQNKLRLAMGPGEHYYFVDACRNTIRSTEIEPGRLGRTFRPSRLGQPVVYTLYSTSRGALAAVASGFGDHLVAGLTGEGRAKVWRDGRLAVLFDSLKRYVRVRLEPVQQRVDSVIEGDGDGVLLEIEPPPDYTCTIRVEGADPADRYEFVLRDSRRLRVGAGSFSGERHEVTLPPGDYYVELSLGGELLTSVDPLPVDLYQDGRVSFRRAGLGAAPTVVDTAELATVAFEMPPGTEVEVVDLQSGERETRTSGGDWDLPAGEYRVELRDPGGPTLRRDELSIEPGDRRTVALDDLSPRPRRRFLGMRSGPAGAEPGPVELDRIADADAAVRLSVLGASRIVGGAGVSGELPLSSFDDVEPGSAPVYVLASLRGTRGRLGVALSRGGDPQWRSAESVARFPGVYQLRIDAEPGAHLVSVRKPGCAPYTFVSHGLADRATLIVLTDSERGLLSVHQYLLPVASLADRLAPEVRERLPSDPIEAVRFAAVAQRRFAAKQPLELAGLGRWHDVWLQFLYGKWLEPIMALVASYELMRRGRLDNVAEVVGNLRMFFPGLPDTEVIARLGGEQTRPATVPILLEGLLVLGDDAPPRPLPDSRLDYAGPWTAWTGAVEPG